MYCYVYRYLINYLPIITRADMKALGCQSGSHVWVSEVRFQGPKILY